MRRCIGRVAALIVTASLAGSVINMPAYAANFRIVMEESASEYTLMQKLVQTIEGLIAGRSYREDIGSGEGTDTYSDEDSQQGDETELQAYYDALLAMSDLSFYQKLSLGADVSILIIGDSIGTGAGASAVEDMWFNVLTDYLEEAYYAGDTSASTSAEADEEIAEEASSGHITLTNLSMGGNGSYAGYVTAMAFEDDIDYDLIILCYGQNDSVSEFSLYYEAMIRALRSKYTNASMISILESSQGDYTEKILDTIELCDYYGIAVVDTIAAFHESGYALDELTVDGIHPSSLGQSLYALYTYAVIDANVSEGTGIVSLPEALDDDVYQYDEFVYYAAGNEYSDGVSEFVRVNETTYTLRVNVSGSIGIHYSFSPGDSVPDIYIDGEMCDKPIVICDYDFTEGLIQVVGKNCMVQQEITVVFEDAGQADGFLGMCFSW